MALLLAALAGWQEPSSADVINGMATYYNDGVMQEVIANRGLGFIDGVALNRKGDLGRYVYLQWDDGTVTGPLPVVDCAQKAHFKTRQSKNQVVEVSAEVAREQGFYNVGPVGVLVWFEKPTKMWN